MTFQLERYLNHLAIYKPETNAEGLALLQQAQLRSITFENIDPLLGTLPKLEQAALTRKLLMQGRGGYCLELNGLLGLALQALGFQITPLLARVHMGREEGGPRSHLAYWVTLANESWLVDAGFGGPAPQRPLLIDTAAVQNQGYDCFRIQQDAASGEYRVEKLEDGDWFVLYSFDKARVNKSDLDAANFICSNWSEAPIAQHLIIYRHTEHGRLSLIDQTFTEEHNGLQTSQEVESSEELGRLIQNVFDIKLSARQMNTLAMRLTIN